MSNSPPGSFAAPGTPCCLVGWVERSETHHSRNRPRRDGFRFAQPILPFPPHSIYRSRGALRPGCPASFRLPRIEGKRSAETAPGCCDTRRRAMTRHAGAPGEAPRASLRRRARPPGAPPWRFMMAPGPRFRLRHFLRRACSDAPRGRFLVTGGRIPVPPEPAGTSRSRGTPLRPPPSGSSLETPLDEPGMI